MARRATPLERRLALRGLGRRVVGRGQRLGAERSSTGGARRRRRARRSAAVRAVGVFMGDKNYSGLQAPGSRASQGYDSGVIGCATRVAAVALASGSWAPPAGPRRQTASASASPSVAWRLAPPTSPWGGARRVAHHEPQPDRRTRPADRAPLRRAVRQRLAADVSQLEVDASRARHRARGDDRRRDPHRHRGAEQGGAVWRQRRPSRHDLPARLRVRGVGGAGRAAADRDARRRDQRLCGTRARGEGHARSSRRVRAADAGRVPAGHTWHVTVQRDTPVVWELWVDSGRLLRLDLPGEELSILRSDLASPR